MEVDMDGDMENTQKDKFTYSLDLSGLVLTPKPETIPNESPAEQIIFKIDIG